MINWAINKDKDGPMKAFNYLGEDLTSDSPTTANTLIKIIVSSIVRNFIANHEIMKISTQRKEVKEIIVEQLRKIATGWGIYIQTVEITDI